MSSLIGRPYRKMNGLGNDFIILDMRAASLDDRDNHPLTAREAMHLADRSGAFGCDQVITLETRDGLPFMDIWNADGSKAGACGNAARCVAHWLIEEAGEEAVAFEGPMGSLSGRRVGDHRVCVDMGVPSFDWQAIPLAEPMEDTRFIDIKLGPIDDPVLWGPSAVNMGNPHCVFFVADAEAQALDIFGPMIENHPLFPERANVSIAQICSDFTIRVRVWERGAGITRACGTAACAVLVCAARRRLTGRKAVINMDGGELAVEWRSDNNRVYMTGPVEEEYRGVI